MILGEVTALVLGDHLGQGYREMTAWGIGKLLLGRMLVAKSYIKTPHRKEKRTAQRVISHKTGKMASNQSARPQKTLTDPEATLDLHVLVPKDRQEIEFTSFAQSTAMTKSIICLMNFFYKAGLHEDFHYSNIWWDRE